MPILNKRANKTPLGLYVHVPFCRSKCQYCDFYSMATKDDKLMDGYLDAVCDHIKEAGELAPGYKVDSVYFGGGTPSFFGADGLAVILTTIRRNFDVVPDAEISVECNPDSVSDRLLHRLYAEGFNRVSLGVQSDDDEILKKLGRPHTYAQAATAYQRIRKAGFRNVSIDLMYGLPGQDLQDWQETLDNVLRLNPEHVSCYALKIEEGTPFYDYKEMLNLPDDETQADMYLAAVEALRSRGFRQYEISNFARKGLYSRHNMKYWTGGEYLGFGPSASSDFAGKRFTLKRDLQGIHRRYPGRRRHYGGFTRDPHAGAGGRVSDASSAHQSGHQRRGIRKAVPAALRPAGRCTGKAPPLLSGDPERLRPLGADPSGVSGQQRHHHGPFDRAGQLPPAQADITSYPPEIYNDFAAGELTFFPAACIMYALSSGFPEK